MPRVISQIRVIWSISVSATSFTTVPWPSPQERRWLADYTSGQVIFDREWDNLRAATQTALAMGDSHSLGRIFTAIGSSAIWSLRYEVGDWAEAATGLNDTHVATFGMAALISGSLGDFERCEALARAGIDVASGASHAETYQLPDRPLCRTHPIRPAQARAGGALDDTARRQGGRRPIW